MKMGSHELQCMENVMMCCSSVRGLLCVWDIVFCVFELCSDEVYEIHTNFFVFFEFDNMT